MAKKLLINKSDTVEHVIELIGKTRDNDLVLVVPRAARLRDSRDELRKLRESVEEMGKTITIESIDEELLALAHAAHLPAAHPFFHSDRRGHGMSDIVRPAPADVDAAPASRKVPVSIVTQEEEGDEEIGATTKQKGPAAIAPRTVPVVIEPDKDDEDDHRFDEPQAQRPARRHGMRRTLATLVIIAAVVAAGVAAAGAFSKPTVDVVLHEVPWTYDGTVTIATGSSTSTPANATVPGQLFVSRKNVTQAYPATGAADGSGTYAEGTIKVFNAHSAEPQELVVKTRFLTPDGKLFRLKEGITVPGATGAAGSLTPSSIDAKVVADQAGDAYNLSDTNIKLSVPGFKGTPRETGFYGMMISTSGGGAGEGAKVTTDGDVSRAESQVKTLLDQSFKAALVASQPKDLIVVDGATVVDVEHISVDRNTDEAGNFSLFVDARLQALAFREADLQTLLVRFAAEQQPQVKDPSLWAFRDVKLTYSEIQPSLDSGTMQMKVHAEGILVAALSPESVVAMVAGKHASEAENILRSFHDVKEADVDAGAIWRNTMPSNPAAIKATIR